MTAQPLAAFIEAELQMTSTDQGGRSRPILSGYRCNCWLGIVTEMGDRAYNDAVIYLESGRTLEPGARATVRVWPAFPDLWSDVVAGTMIEVCEGSRVVGEATVTHVHPSI